MTSTTVVEAPDRVLSAAEVERLLGLHKITLVRMRQLDDCGGLPFIRLSPNRIGYLQSDVTAFLAARRVGRLPTEKNAE